MARAKYLAMMMGIAVAMAIASIEPWATFADGGSQQELLSVKQLANGDVVGHLGYPLGTVVRITGTCLDGKRTQRRANLGKTLLEIRTVNGKELERPIIVPFGRAAKEVTKPEDGDVFDYYAHEWGAFDGVVEIPKSLGIDQPMVANDGFHYRPHISIHKSNAVSP